MVTPGPAPRWARRALAAALLTSLWACDAPPEPRTAAAPPLPTLPPPAATPARSIDPDPGAAARIAADVGYLASPKLGGRGTGDEGARLAADFIAKRFGELRLKPFGGGSGQIVQTYLQAFDARVGADVSPPSLRLLQGKKAAAAPPEAIVTADGSESGAATGAAVFVGHGITSAAAKWDDYAGGEIAGKIAVILDGVPKGQETLRDFGAIRYKLRTAREHKAIGAVIVTAGDLPKNPQDSSGMGIPAVVLSRAAAEKRLPAAQLGDQRTWEPAKASAPRPLPGATIEVTTHITARSAKTWNVVGLLPAKAGSPRAGEYVVLGAHYDHLGHGGPSSRAVDSTEAHLGADDNASGTAMVLECARRLAALPEAPDRNIVFVAFGAEELGTIGSRYFVEHPPAPLAVGAIVGMINADMVGRLREDKLLVDGIGTAAGWEPLVKAASEGLGLKLAYGAEGFGASDHAPFTAARVPVSFLFTGVHEDYHKPSDTADKVNAEGAARVATLASRLTLALSQRPERLAFVDVPTDPHRSMRGGGFRSSLGTIPDYAYQGKGVKVTGARPDSPAARAGIQANDVIVKLGPHEITNVHDYVFALKELEPGREIVVEVDRGGTRVPLKVIPAPGK